MTVAILFVRQDSAYKAMQGVDCYDIDRDARNFTGGCPVVAHPPCRAWGILAHMANPRPDEKELAILALGQVRKNGGVLEHPSGSRLWQVMGLPEEGMFPDEFGGYTVLIDQYAFGHVANNPTKLYVCGVPLNQLPPIPTKAGRAAKSITGQVEGTKRCTQYERECTPEALRLWLIETARLAKRS
jgi:hypothetical protein